MQPHYQAAFKAARARIQSAYSPAEWICKSGFWPDAADPKSLTLKLLKPHWSSDPSEVNANTCGIFFSAWTDTDPRHPSRLRYNIHALKLRALPGYKLESRKFAAAFRAAFTALNLPWPNNSLEYGPQTLMEGFVEITSSTCESELVALAKRFHAVVPLIDELLANAAQSPGR